MEKVCAWGRVAALGSLLAATAAAHAGVTVLVGEPYGSFGTMLPVGHTAVYLDRVCADGPLKLRMCHAGETPGVVISRYHQLADYDWMATPVLEFLYATERPADVPASMTPALAWEMRQSYRRQYLETIVPDGTEKAKGTDEWWESAGSTFDRRLWGYTLATSVEQDRAFVEHMNALPNRHLYHLVGSNCADFAADAVRFYFPAITIVPRHGADLGYLTPLQVAHSIEMYAQAHPQAGFAVAEIPQLPGTLRRSRPLRGSAEMLLTTKRYLFTLLVIQPEVPVVMTALFLHGGRWQIGAGAELATPERFAAMPASTAGNGTPASVTQPTQVPAAASTTSH